MSIVRIPVSLKLDDSSDVYRDFISDLRESKKLSDFLVDFLNMYYDDDEVRALINLKRELSDPLTQVQEQLRKIQQQHNKTVMATTVLANQTSATIQNIEAEGLIEGHKGFPDVGEEGYTMGFGTAPGMTPQTTAQYENTALHHQYLPPPNERSVAQNNFNLNLAKRIDEMEKLLPSIDSKLNQLLTSMTNTQPITPTFSTQPQPTQQHQQQPTHQTQTQPQPQPQPEQPTYETPVMETPQVQTPQVETPQVETQIPTPAPSFEEPSFEATAPQMISSDQQEDTTPEPPPKKPASFGKAFGSLKKNK